MHVFAYDSARGNLRALQRASALPAAFNGKPWAADLHLSPSGRHLYASERTSSTLSTFTVDAATGLLQALGQTPTEKTPRSFSISAITRNDLP